jgi:hypothetical protein
MTSMLLVQSSSAFVIQWLGVGSAALLFLSGLSLFVALAVNSLVMKTGQDVSLWAYAIGQSIPSTTGAQMLYGVLEVFVPLVCTPAQSLRTSARMYISFCV